MIPQQTPVKNHKGNNSATTFDFNFYIENEEQLLVTHTDLEGNITTPEYGVDYTIAAFKQQEGSSITFPIQGSSYGILAKDTSTGKEEILSIALSIPIEQPAEYNISGDLNKKNLEYSFDWLTRICQILKRQIDRAVKVDEGTDINTAQLVRNINTAIEHLSNIDTVADDKENIDAVAGNKTNIDTVAGSITNVNKVGNDIANVNTVADDKTNVDTVAGSISNVNTVAGSISNVNIVANDKTNIDTVAGDKANIDTVAGDKANIDTVAGSISNVNTVAGDIANVNTVAGDKTNIDTVAGDKANIDTVAGSITGVNTCATNIAAILDAPNQAEIATAQAEIATDKADETNVALAQAQEMKNSLSFFQFFRGGSLDTTPQATFSGGDLDRETPLNVYKGGTLNDIRLCLEDLINIEQLPVLHTRIKNDEDLLDNTISRVGVNEEKIIDLQEQINELDGDIAAEILDINGEISGAKGRISQNELDIGILEDSLAATDMDLGALETRTDAAEIEIKSIFNLVDIFNNVKGGNLDSTRSKSYSGGNLDTTYTLSIKGGNLDTMCVSKEDLRNTSVIPYLKSQVQLLTEQLNYALNFIANMKTCGITAGNLDNR